MTAHSLSDCGSCAVIDRAYSSSVRERVEDVIDTKLIRESGHGKRITGIIGMLPRIADIHVVVRDDHQAMVVIVDALPLRRAFHCLLYTSDAADERSSVDLGGRRI